MLELQHASIGGAEVLLLLKVPAEGQSITCGINFSSAACSRTVAVACVITESSAA